MFGLDTGTVLVLGVHNSSGYYERAFDGDQLKDHAVYM